MKKYILILLIILTLFYTAGSARSLAVSATATPSSPTQSPTEDLDKQINDLKDRIASRVAQLNLVEKKGIIGTVSDVSESQITVTDSYGNINFIDVDELTNFSSPTTKGSFGISDISNGMTIGVLGLYNKESRRILARFVNVLTLPQIISGVVLDLNSSDYSFIAANVENKEYTVEVETVTKTYVYTSGSDGLVKSGFSKLQLGERVFIVGFFDAKDKSKIIASRIIRFPSLPVNPKISIAPTVVPSPTLKAQSKTKSTSQ